jgi:hypothetical protein
LRVSSRDGPFSSESLRFGMVVVVTVAGVLLI